MDMEKENIRGRGKEGIDREIEKLRNSDSRNRDVEKQREVIEIQRNRERQKQDQRSNRAKQTGYFIFL